MPNLDCHQDLYAAVEIMLSDYMCVRAGEQVLVTADIDSDGRICEAIRLVGRRLGAQTVILSAARLPFQGALADPYVSPMQAGAIQACDVWLDLAFPYFAGSHVHDAVMQAEKCRYLLLGDVKAESVIRLFGGVDLDLYFAAQDAFDSVFRQAQGKVCHIRDGAGTDVKFNLAASSLTKPRRCEVPGMYLVPGSCSIAPQIETVQGVIVVSAVFHEYYERLWTPITLNVDDKVQTMNGGGSSWDPLERALRRAGKGCYGSVIHFTHGLHPAARFTGRSFIEDMRTIGSNAVGLGVPWWEPGGGENHPDAVLTSHSVWIDSELVIDRGRVVAPAALTEKTDKLKPQISDNPITQ